MEKMVAQSDTDCFLNAEQIQQFAIWKNYIGLCGFLLIDYW